jgi:pimeloyl-ACP methyl ester carboxylesterase
MMHAVTTQRRLSSAGLSVVVVLAACAAELPKQAEPTPNATAPAVAPIPYGANKDAGATFAHDGVTLYYETYGQGEPLLLVHGNGLSIGSMAAQIEHFKAKYRVIAMDSRDHGKSGDSDGPINYEKMTDDLAALLDHLKTGPVDVLGWSDGGIEALLLGVRHPDQVKKLVSMAPNLTPGREAIDDEVDRLVKDMLAGLPDDVRKTSEGKRQIKVTEMLLKEPHITPALLNKVTAPTLVLAGDHDLIRLEHIVAIYKSLPNSELAIFPNSTHMVPYDDPALFNGVVERFLSAPFKKRDRIPETMASLEKLAAGLAK